MKQDDTYIKATPDKTGNQVDSASNAYQIGLEKLPDNLKQDLDNYLCLCNGVTRSEVIHAICEGADTFIKVRAKTYASAGNACCREEIEELLECLTAEEEESTKDS